MLHTVELNQGILITHVHMRATQTYCLTFLSNHSKALFSMFLDRCVVHCQYAVEIRFRFVKMNPVLVGIRFEK